MITFTYRPYVSKTSGIKFIEWKAVWDGVHETSDNIHPFFGTGAYEQRLAYKEKFKEEDLAKGTWDEETDEPDAIRELCDVVADNPVTRALCEALSLTLKELDVNGYSGNTCVVGYRNRLLVALDSLWD